MQLIPKISVPRTAHAALCVGLASALLLSACAQEEDHSEAADQSPERTVEPVRGTELPIDTLPEQTGQGDIAECPYIAGDTLQSITGQRLTGTGIDQRFDPPACVFWSYEDEPQARVMVRHMTTNQDAVKVVDWAAPIDSTQKALKPEGWSGGRRGGGEEISGDPGPGGHGAVYAVWKDETAVVVFTAQEQSVKAENIATEVINNLGL